MDPAARARIDQWKLSLLEVVSSAEQRLLDAAGCVGFSGTDARAIAAALEAGTSLGVEVEGAPRGDEQLHSALSRDDLARSLSLLRRELRVVRTDRGAQGLWLALGTLHIPADDARGAASIAAPLVLWPVELERDGSGFRIAPSRRAPIANPLLAAVLVRDHGLILASGELAGAAGVDELLGVAEGFATTRPGWRVDRAVCAGVFAPERAALWGDLEALGDALYASDGLIGHLAAQRGVALAQPSGAAAAAVTQRPRGIEQLLAPLDADVHQLAAVAAARAGATFVLSGPPGTGKSQTIANLLVDCASAGKTVLFESGKAPALDVVQQRLAALGLGELCMDLHAPGASGGQLAGQLARVLERPFRPG
ncbi:MAG: DUF4011 domain-containing protein, partial [Deltaproteobacteria bacterium]|nr:DUF4011 domain-containing protein [Deltaproteobacteria bacterium]